MSLNMKHQCLETDVIKHENDIKDRFFYYDAHL